MTARGYRITETNRLEAVPAENVIEAWQKGEDSYWLDLVATGFEVLEQWLAGVDMNPVIAQVCSEDGEISRVVPSRDTVYFRLPIHTGESNGEVAYVGALCLPRLLVTFHDGAAESLRRLATGLQSTSVEELSSTSRLVLLVLLQESSAAIQRGMKLRSRIDRLTDEMERDPDAVKFDQIRKEKATVRALDTVNEESRYVYGCLRVLDLKALNLVGLKSYFQVVVDNAEFLDRKLDRQQSRLAELHQQYLANLQGKTNQRLAVLTVISAIFLPLTLIAGIYGMNFEKMPELAYRYAYPIALGVMATIAVGMWTYVKRKGWFE